MRAMLFLVTGAAGFIGSHVAHKLLDRGDEVVGLDNVNDYYDPKLKEARLARLTSRKGFTFVKIDIANRAAMDELFAKYRFPRVIHLAAQAGVRYSITHPYAYIEANIVGFQNVLEGCRHNGCEHLTYASTSSVYGANTTMPFSVHHSRESPADALRRDQEGERALRPHLLEPLRPADDRPPLLHRLRTVGPARHGALPLRQEHPRGEADRRLQPRPPHAATSPTSTTSPKASCAPPTSRP